jgi:Protein of unknown function (DUF2924)
MTGSGLESALSALETMTRPQLKAEWRGVYRAPAPHLNTNLLARGIAYALQEKVMGGPSRAAHRALAAVYSGQGAPSPDVNVRPGTRLVRSWNGVTHAVLVVEGGYCYENETYTSLSAIACRITGTHWSGPRFFGLKAKPATRRVVRAD